LEEAGTYTSDFMGNVVCCFSHFSRVGFNSFEGLLYITPGALKKMMGIKSMNLFLVMLKKRGDMFPQRLVFLK